MRMNSKQEEPNIFLTTTDLINKLNGCIQASFEADLDNGSRKNEATITNNQGDSTKDHIPKFELRSRFEDGTTRLLDESEKAYADYKFKMSQATNMIANLDPRGRMEWALTHRQIGNRLYSEGKYQEAIDVYMTCLVALNQQNDGQIDRVETKAVDESYSDDTITPTEDEMDKSIKLPILLNLSACMLKLSMYTKAEKICNLCLETVPCASNHSKVFFRRGRARMHMGLYLEARKDFEHTLSLLSSVDRHFINHEESNPMNLPEIVHERNVVSNEIRKLEHLEKMAKENHSRQKKAMQRTLGGCLPRSADSVEPTSDGVLEAKTLSLHSSNEQSLYQDRSQQRAYSRLTADCTSIDTTTIKSLKQSQVYLWPFVAFLCLLLLKFLNDTGKDSDYVST